MERVLIEGVSLDEHRRLFPERWRSKKRAWPEFWSSFLIVPIMAGINALYDVAWDGGDTNFAAGWILAHFLIAQRGELSGAKTTWTLDKVTLRQRFNHLWLELRGARP